MIIIPQLRKLRKQMSAKQRAKWFNMACDKSILDGIRINQLTFDRITLGTYISKGNQILAAHILSMGRQIIQEAQDELSRLSQ
jgi:hypothetical protein